MKEIIKINESELQKLISESVKSVLKNSLNEDLGDTENIRLYDVLRHISESEINDLLMEHVYNDNDEDLGQLGYLHIKYSPKLNE